LVGLFATGLLASSSAAEVGARARATLTSKVPMSAVPGTRFTLTWKVEGSGGKPFASKGMFVRVVCPEGDVVTRAAATATATAGAYRARVTVPAGGIGVISIGAGSPPTYFAITNPAHR
jgi:hypothetical protein